MIGQKNSSIKTAGDGTIPLQILTFIVSDELRLERFLALSGLTPGDLRDRAQDPVFQAFMCDYLLQDESQFLEFASQHDIKPEWIVRARRSLPGYEI